MGLFWTSESDRIIEQVENTAGEINRYLSKLQTSLMTNNGATHNNINELYDIDNNLANLQIKMTNLLSQLSPSKQSGITVSWIDGRHFPLVMWQMSYNAAIAKLKYAIQLYGQSI